MEFIFAGFGGQGIMAMGMLLAHAAIKEGFKSSFIPSYGPEMRGGTANCSVVVEKGLIASPVVTEPDILVAMNYPSLIKFKDTVKKAGHLFINSSLITSLPEVKKDIQIHQIPANELALKIGESRASNMVMLGAVLAVTNLISLKTAIEDLNYIFKNKPEVLAVNKKALETGYNSLKEEQTKTILI
ncbi:2-oxoacid:acceptor oxidoreductase family protein [Carboxydothermus pertinax]|uniref:2-oxoacid:ferredoxin oxidoreductase subunit gamma n=1 Tax=Carboxydothermus pertinax TaxID=870242 RepID=A0A1L8CTJ8_9THEO|nr:2-oxoacid:acceptor oxidoreductase family protein [Carboxydothermus pertinax]GAV22227.1 2-oxoacid:ferredoxin oxidoreductase subunit gamma [Carboxydothermus pertinax]